MVLFDFYLALRREPDVLIRVDRAHRGILLVGHGGHDVIFWRDYFN